MKPSDLPFYDENPSNNEPVYMKDEVLNKPLENGVMRAREFVKDNTQPLQSAFSTAKTSVSNYTSKTTEFYTYLQKENILYNGFVIGSSVAGGWLIQAVFYPKPWRIRRLMTPVLFGAFATSFLYQEKVASSYEAVRDAALKQLENMRNK